MTVREKWQRLYNLVAALAHPHGDHQSELEGQAHDLIRELRDAATDHGILYRRATPWVSEEAPNAVSCPHCTWPTTVVLFCSACRQRLCGTCSDVSPERRGCRLS